MMDLVHLRETIINLFCTTLSALYYGLCDADYWLIENVLLYSLVRFIPFFCTRIFLLYLVQPLENFELNSFKHRLSFLLKNFFMTFYAMRSQNWRGKLLQRHKLMMLLKQGTNIRLFDRVRGEATNKMDEIMELTLDILDDRQSKSSCTSLFSFGILLIQVAVRYLKLVYVQTKVMICLETLGLINTMEAEHNQFN